MNVNPISFGKTMKIVGRNQAKAAQQVAYLVNGGKSSSFAEFQKQERLMSEFSDATICNPAVVLSLNSGKEQFVLTGREAKKLQELKNDRDSYIERASRRYKDNKHIMDVIVDSENDRFEALAGKLADDTQSGIIKTDYSTKHARLTSLSINV